MEPKEKKKTEPAPASAVVTTKEKNVRDMDTRELIGSGYMLEQITRALPSVGLTAERFQRVIVTAIGKNPKLAECTPQSVALAVMSLAQVGLEPDGRHAHLIPRRNGKTGTVDCQAQLDYKGLVALVRRSGDISTIHADSVCEHDVFEYDLGVIRKHVVDFKKPRGGIYAVYALAVLKDGTQQATVMSLEEIKAIAERSNGVQSAKRFGGTTPWDTDFSEMAKKTVFRRLTKWLPLSYEAATAIRDDEDREFRKPVDITPSVGTPSSTESINQKLKAPKRKEPVAEPVIDGEFVNDEAEQSEPASQDDGDL